jgi:O-antigen ligase
MAMTTSPVPPTATAWSRWGARSLDVARVAAIVGAVAIPVSTALVSTACGVLVLALVLSGQAHRVLSRAFSQPLGLAILVFFLVIAAGMLHGPADWPERLGSLWSWRKLLYAFLLLGLFGDEVWKRRFAWTLAGASLVGVLASFAAFAGWIPSRDNTEIGVLFQNHTTQGLVFSVGIVCCVQLASSTRGAWRWAMVAAAVLLVLNILFVSPGRSTYLVIAAIPVVLGVQRFGWRRVPALVSIVVVLAVAAYAFSSMVRERVDLAWQEVTTHETSQSLTSVGFRAVVYRNTAELIAAHPIAGYGTGSFREVYTAHVRGRYTDWRGEGTADPHNQYLLIAMETGVIGLLAFVGILVTAFRVVRTRSPWAWVGVTVLAGWILTSLFNSHFRTFAEGHLVAFVLGAMLARDLRSADAHDGR